MALLRDGLQPTDFADAELRVSEWYHHDFYGRYSAYRVWVCKCGNGYWFQRHEWARTGANSTELDDWLFSGYSHSRKWNAGMKVAETPEDWRLTQSVKTDRTI